MREFDGVFAGVHPCRFSRSGNRRKRQKFRVDHNGRKAETVPASEVPGDATRDAPLAAGPGADASGQSAEVEDDGPRAPEPECACGDREAGREIMVNALLRFMRSNRK